MLKVTKQQGGEDWLNWRKDRLTATDAASLLGCNPWITPYKCWQRKTGQAEEQAVTPAMLRGQTDEPIARKMFTAESNINMMPCCIESETYLFLGASLDGISDCGRYLLEIKSQSIDKIKDGGIPVYHMCQMQHQLLCTDGKAEMCFYVSICGNEIHIIEVYPDKKWMDDYIPKAKEFWKQCVFLEAPTLSKGDYKDMSEDSLWYGLAQQYKTLNERIKSMETAKEEIKKSLVSICNNESGLGAGIKVLKKMSKGRIDYPTLIESLNINEAVLEQYRGKSTESWAIMIDK